MDAIEFIIPVKNQSNINYKVELTYLQAFILCMLANEFILDRIRREAKKKDKRILFIHKAIRQSDSKELK